MVCLEIDRNNLHLIKELNEYLANKDNKVFILYYMEGCGPCNATRPEWAKLKNVLPSNGLDRNDIIVAAIDQILSDKLKVGKPPSAFPTMRFITNNGKLIENYEDANISLDKDRTVDSFVEWIRSKTTEEAQRLHGHMTRRKRHSMRGGKWSRKYKRSINCRRPKGFSQRQYCKYGRKKQRR